MWPDVELHRVCVCVCLDHIKNSACVTVHSVCAGRSDSCSREEGRRGKCKEGAILCSRKK